MLRSPPAQPLGPDFQRLDNVFDAGPDGDQHGTEAASYDGKLDEDEVRLRLEHVSGLVEELNAQRAEERIGETVEVLVESIDGDTAEGRGAHQGPEVDGTTTISGLATGTRVGDLVRAVVHDTDGVDLLARPVGAAR